MKSTFFLFAITLISWTSLAQSNSVPDKVPYEQNPETPSQKALETLKPIRFELLTEQMKQTPDKKRTIRFYTLKNEPYSGWVLQLFENNEHKYRYMKFERGLTVWQIGYYDNGDLDLDFHLKDGINCGSQRMWRKNGEKYIDTYMTEGGKQEGLQLRWHANNIPAREAMFENGNKVYEVLFDSEGKVTKTTGNIPEKYR